MYKLQFLPHDAMHKCGLCISVAYAVMRCLSVCVSVTFVNSVKTNTRIFKIFSLSSSQAILVFRCQTVWNYSDGNPPNGGVECRWGRKKSRFWANIWLHCVCCEAFQCSKLSCDEPLRVYNTSRWWAAEFVDGIMAGNKDKVYDKKPQHYTKDNVTRG